MIHDILAAMENFDITGYPVAPPKKKPTILCVRSILSSSRARMADAVAFNSVPPPSGASVDPSSAFADALKRAKEVLYLFQAIMWHLFN